MEKYNWQPIENFKLYEYTPGTFINVRVEYAKMNDWDLHLGWIVGSGFTCSGLHKGKLDVVNGIYLPYLHANIKKFKITHFCIVPDLVI